MGCCCGRQKKCYCSDHRALWTMRLWLQLHQRIAEPLHLRPPPSRSDQRGAPGARGSRGLVDCLPLLCNAHSSNKVNANSYFSQQRGQMAEWLTKCGSTQWSELSG